MSGSEPLPVPIAEIAERTRQDVELLTREIGEIELLVTQARAEAARHEQKRSQMAERLQSLAGQPPDGGAGEVTEQLLSLTGRAAMMAAQVDVLAGKLKVLNRFREAVLRYGSDIDHAVVGPITPPVPDETAGQETPLPPAISRTIQAAQEDLRREIARAMHDGPAQSLTNIVLQAQIVDRLLDRDPTAARVEIGQLVAMVQQTLEATKAFIFDVRPMVLDDLGLVPTLRRVARDRGRRSQIPIEFESFGSDRRLPMDVESGLFRIVDEAVGGFISCRPDAISLRLDWSDQVQVRVIARQSPAEPLPEEGSDGSSEQGEHEEAQGSGRSGRGRSGGRRASSPERELPAALRAMIEEQRADASRAAQLSHAVGLSVTVWREIQQRAETIGVCAELLDEGRELALVLPSLDRDR